MSYRTPRGRGVVEVAICTSTVVGRPVDHQETALDRALIVVTGKGGVGKTTVAAAIALAAARRGRRTLALEVAGQRRIPAPEIIETTTITAHCSKTIRQ